jgi:type II secretory pathway component HofQ
MVDDQARAYHRRMPMVAVVLSLLSLLAVPTAPDQRSDAQRSDDGEARISMDFKDADIVDVVRLLSEVGGFQVVFHPGINCKLTLKIREVRWTSALDVALKTCGLGRDEESDIVRVAPIAKLREEAAERRKYQEERAVSGERTVSRYRLSYARAAEMAPIVKKFLSPRGEVVFDARTNTLIIID